MSAIVLILSGDPSLYDRAGGRRIFTKNFSILFYVALALFVINL